MIYTREASLGRVLLLSILPLFAFGDRMLQLIDGPVSINVSYNDEASFNCSCANADEMIWLLNDTYQETLLQLETTQEMQNMDHGEGEWTLFGRFSTSITGFAKILNNTEVICKCIRVCYYPFVMVNVVESIPAKLLLQGTLASPTDVTALFTEKMLQINWVPPNKLQGVSILAFNVDVTITHEDTYKNKIIENTTNTELILRQYDQSSCTYYNICVSAFTLAGMGEKACITRNREYGVPRSLTTEDVTAYVVKNGSVKGTVQVIYKFGQDPCQGDQENSAVIGKIQMNTKAFCPLVSDTEFSDENGANKTLKVLLRSFLSSGNATSIIVLSNSQGSVSSEIIPVYFSDSQSHFIAAEKDQPSAGTPHTGISATIILMITFISLMKNIHTSTT